MQAFVDARYEYHWAPLIGCLTAQLEHIGIGQPSYVIGAATGLSYRAPDSVELPPTLSDGLVALGARSTVTSHRRPNRLQRALARRRIRNELRARRPVAAFGVGLSAFGPTYGLIVGYDDDRMAWRRDGPLTDQVSRWLEESEFASLPCLTLITARLGGEFDPDLLRQTATASLDAAIDSAQTDLLNRITLLGSDQEIEPQRFSYDAQALAANWGEAAAFWREIRHQRYGPASQHVALALSRYATLFPYPMGGQPNSPGVRSAAVRILLDAAEALGTDAIG